MFGKKVVACVDEFEKVADNADFSVAFFDGLRSLAQDNLALVTATQHSLADLCRDKKFAGSQFWNIFQRSDLCAFTGEEAWQFVSTRFTQAGVAVSDDEIARVLRLAGAFPFYVQMSCYHLFDARANGAAGWVDAFAQEAHDHLRALWETRSEQEQAALNWALGFGSTPPHQWTLDELKRRGLLIQIDRRHWVVFSEAFARFIEELPPSHRAARRIGFKANKVEFTPTPPWVKLSFEVGGPSK